MLRAVSLTFVGLRRGRPSEPLCLQLPAPRPCVAFSSVLSRGHGRGASELPSRRGRGADDASSSMCQNTGVFGTPEELDLGTWYRQVVRTSVVEKLCQVRAPLATDPALELLILHPCANDVCAQAALSGTLAAFVSPNQVVDGRGTAGKYRAAVWASTESDPS